MTEPETPARVRITSPRTAARRARPMAVTHEIDAQTALGEVYLRSLIRSQLRLAAAVLALVGLCLAGLPAVFAFAPAAADVHVFGVPLPWLLLGVVVYPLLVGVSWSYVRIAERNERAFAALVDPS